MVNQTALLLATALVGCTAVTDARDYEVDPAVAIRDLDFSFEVMPHQMQALDVAVVNADKQMQARARILLAPNLPDGEIPTEHLVLTRGLKPADYELYFFVDADGSYSFQPGEHNWIEPVPPSGKGDFVHSTNFAPSFNESDFTQLNSDIVFDLPSLPAGGVIDPVRACAAQKLEAAKVFEIKVFLKLENRQVGLFKTYAGNRLTRDLLENGIRIEGILDAGSDYVIQVFANDELIRTANVTASPDPNVKELRLPAGEWLPAGTVTSCQR